MDSLENKVPQEVETVQPEVATPAETPAVEETKTNAPTKEDIVERFKTLLQGQVSDIKEEAEQLKTQFYRIYKQEQEEVKRQMAAAQEKAEDIKEEISDRIDEYKPVIDELEQNFKELLAIYKKRKAEDNARREAEMEQNQLRKENIIAQMKAMSESETADVAAHMQQFKALQQDWKNIGPVPPTVATSLWKEYNLYQEKF